MKNFLGFIAWLGGMATIFFCCSGIVSCVKSIDDADKQVKIGKLMSPLKENDHTFKVLYIYPDHGGKGHFAEYVAVVEGIKTKERIVVASKPAFPIPGEIWTIKVSDFNFPRYEFTQKVE